VYISATFCSFGFFVVGFILPIIAYSGMGASPTQVALVFSLLTLGAAIFSPVAGRIAKGGRRRPVAAIGAIVRAGAYIGMTLSVIYNSVAILILNSLVWGLGAGFYRVGVDAEVSERVLVENRAEAFGHLQASNGKGSVIGAMIGFGMLFNGLPVTMIFMFFAVANIIGGAIVVADRRPRAVDAHEPARFGVRSAVGISITALVVAAALDTFISAVLSPFVELYILAEFTSDVALVAIVYLPGGIIQGIGGGYMGRFADHANKIAIVAVAVVVGAISTLGLVFIPELFAEMLLLPGILDIPLGLFLVMVLFSTTSVTGVLAYTVMSSVFGTVYQGRASEGFGMFEAAMGFSRFTGPIVGGLLWEATSNPASPFLLVGGSGFVLVPIYIYGMRKYQEVLEERGIKPEIIRTQDI
jgi:MFS family permease